MQKQERPKKIVKRDITEDQFIESLAILDKLSQPIEKMILKSLAISSR